jgi:hypothetical protein
MRDQIMRDQIARPTGPAADGPCDLHRSEEAGVIDFASWVVALLAARRSGGQPVLRADLLERFRAAACAEDDGPLSLVMAEFLREKVPAAAVADLYIPALAARLGEDWMDDVLGFAEVSLATARLQAMLRAMGAAWAADAACPGASEAIVLCTAPGEQHTLGALVLLGRIRREGVSVRLLLGPTAAELRDAFERVAPRGVLISAAGTGRLAQLRDFVKTIRQVAPPGLPVIVGGGVVAWLDDAAAATGTDLAATSLDEALAACGVGHMSARNARLRA